MSTFVTSKGTRGQHVSPKWTSQPYRQNPGRREHIHGKIQPMTQRRTCGLQIMSNAIMLGLFAVIVVLSAVKGWNW